MDNNIPVYREMRKWRTKLNELCCQFLEECSDKYDNDGFGEHFIKMSFDRIKRTIGRCRNEPFMQNERCRPNRHKEGPGLMFAHLDQIEHTTRIFLRTTDIELNEKFMKYFCRQCEECIKEAFDVFTGWFKYANDTQNAPEKEDKHKKHRSETEKKPSNRNGEKAVESPMATSKGDTQSVKRNRPAECQPSVATKKIKLIPNKENTRSKDPSSVSRKIVHTKQPIQSSEAARCIPEFRFFSHSAQNNRPHDVTKRSSDKEQTKSHQTGARSDKKTHSKSSDDKRSHDGRHKKSRNSEKHASDRKEKKITIGMEVVRENKSNHTGTGSNKNTPNRSADDKRPNNVGNAQKKTLQRPIDQKVNGKRSHPFKNADPTKSHKIVTKPSNQKTAVTDTIQIGTKPHAGCLVYHCFHCKNVKKSAQFNNKIDFYQHCLSEHGKQETHPIKFYAVETVICKHCGEVGTFEELRDHHSQMHPNEVFVILSGTDKNKCALCDYNGKCMNIHFKVKHSTISVFSPVRMSIANLQKLQIENIHRFICCQKYIDPSDLLEHMQQHENTCSICESYKSKDIFDILVHLKEAHNYHEYNRYLENLKDSLKKEFYETQAMFTNGLVLFNCNLAGTKYDHITEFIVEIDDWINLLKMEFEQRIQNKYILKVIVPYIEGENTKMILGNLRRVLGVQTSHDDILRVQRAPLNRAILVECRDTKFKEEVMKRSLTKKVYLSELIDMSSVYSFPPNMNGPVTFE